MNRSQKEFQRLCWQRKINTTMISLTYPIRLTMFSLLLSFGSNTWELLNRIKAEAKKEIGKSIRKEAGKNTSKNAGKQTIDRNEQPALGGGDRQILSDCGLTEISLQPIGKSESNSFYKSKGLDKGMKVEKKTSPQTIKKTSSSTIRKAIGQAAKKKISSFLRK